MPGMKKVSDDSDTPNDKSKDSRDSDDSSSGEFKPVYNRKVSVKPDVPG
jgi:hypothetical protein